MRSFLRLSIALSALGLFAAAASAQGPGGGPPGRPPVSGASVFKALAESWPDRPEWLDQYTAILTDSYSGPNDGWFRRSKAQTRFDWKSIAARLDKDGDGKITPQEFGGSEADFARLDRSHDGTLAEVDFDFSAHALTPSAGSLLQYVLDADGNGKVTREEFDAFFKKADTGDLGFLSLNDLQESFRADARPRAAEPVAPPTREALIGSLFRQEMGALQAGPSLGEPAPDFTLKTKEGDGELVLSKLVGPKPVVLVFGNFTCGPFRSQAGNVEKLYRRYKDRAEFVMVYVREAHPIDGWRMDGNEEVGVATAQPRTYDERVAVARKCGSLLGLGFPMLVDAIDDPVGSKYSGMPSRLYVIDREGKVAYKSGRGPFGFKPAELEHSLLLLLQQIEAEKPKSEGDKQAARPLAPPTEGPGPFKMLSDAEAWDRMPPIVEGERQPLPAWARVTAHGLPRTTAAMLELDRLHRTENPIGPVLRGKMRWVAADANGCDFTRRAAEADLAAAGVSRSDIDALKGGSDAWPDDERAALRFASQMTRDASKVSDREVETLRRTYGDSNLVAMVQLLAFSNFQDRLLLGLGVKPEEDGPLGPVAARFSREQKERPIPPRAKPEELSGPPVPERVDDPEWAAVSFEELQGSLGQQKANPGRIRVPTSEEVMAGIPEGQTKPKAPMRIKWSLVCFGYQPVFADAWTRCMRAYDAESKLDDVFGESLFWVVTRSIHCFY